MIHCANLSRNIPTCGTDNSPNKKHLLFIKMNPCKFIFTMIHPIRNNNYFPPFSLASKIKAHHI